MRKIKKWQVSVLNDYKSRKIRNDDFRTADTDAWIELELFEDWLVPSEATISLENLTDGSIVSLPMELDENTFKWHMEKEIIAHAGVWEFSIIFNKDGEDYVGPKISFKVEGYLLDGKEPALEIIDDWKVLRRQIRAFAEAEALREESELERLHNEGLRVEAEVLREENYAESVEIKEVMDQQVKDVSKAEDTRKENETVRITNENKRVGSFERIETESTGLIEEMAGYKDELDKKVEKETGKGLSTNDYTDLDKQEVGKVKDKLDIADAYDDTAVKKTLDSKANKLEVATNKRELDGVRNSLAQWNPNQEVKQTVEGADVISLPKNAGEGAGTVRLEGLTVTNLVENGDFESEAIFFESVGLTKEIKESYLATKNNIPQGRLIKQSFFDVGNIYFIGLNIKPLNAFDYFNVVGLSAIGANDVLLNEYNKISLYGSATQKELRLNLYGEGLKVNIDYITAINLTQTFGAGNEPSKEWCGAHLADYIDGAKSVAGPRRIKSVGKNLFDGELENGTLSSVGTETTHSGRKRTSFIELEKDVTYIYTVSGSSSKGRWEYDSNYNFIYLTFDQKAFKIKENTKYVRFSWYNTSEDIQLEKGTSATTYVPYIASHLYLNNDVELRSLPNGIKDEIRPDGKGGYELVKRVSDELIELEQPIITPVSTSGQLTTYPSGTVYFEDIATDANIYNDQFDILESKPPIKELDKVILVNGDDEIELDISDAKVSEDGMGFTHSELSDDDVVFVEYYYESEQPIGNNSVGFYDSRYTIKDSVTGEFYNWKVGVANGEPTIKLEGV